MRILHSSDWHLGQHFMGRSRQAEHRQLIEWLLEQVSSLQVDLVLIAGDLFDTGTPPSYARGLFNHLVKELHGRDCRLLVLGGNHDSVATLGEGVDILPLLGTEVRPSVNRAEQTLYLARNRDNSPEAVVIACPYLRPRDIVRSAAGQSAADKRRLLLESMDRFFAESYEAARQLAEQHQPALPIILSAHLTAVGGELTESVRELYIGTLDAFPAESFPPVDYIALGHLHRPQQLRGERPVIYSGSPIALSFDEASKKKSVQLIELGPGRPLQHEVIEIPCFQPMAAISGNLEAIAEKLPQLVQDAQLTDGQTLWLQASVAEDDYLTDLVPRIEKLSEELPVEILRIQRQRKVRQQMIAQGVERETLVELEPGEVFARRLAQEEVDQERKTLLQQSFMEIFSEINELENKASGNRVNGLSDTPDSTQSAVKVQGALL